MLSEDIDGVWNYVGENSKRVERIGKSMITAGKARDTEALRRQLKDLSGALQELQTMLRMLDH